MAVEENNFESTDPNPLKCGHQCKYVLDYCTLTNSHLESVKQNSDNVLLIARETRD